MDKLNATLGRVTLRVLGASPEKPWKLQENIARRTGVSLL